MFCPNCGSNNFNNGYCPNCGYNLNQQPVQQIPQQNYQQPKKSNLPLIIGGIVVVIVIVLAIFLLGGGSKEKFMGTWDCKGYTTSSGASNSYMVTMELNSDNTYRFGQYGDLDKNHFKGKYTSSYEDDKKAKYNKDFYILNFSIDEYIENGVNQNKTSKMEFEMEFIDDNQTLIINTSTLSMYYCYKR